MECDSRRRWISILYHYYIAGGISGTIKCKNWDEVNVGQLGTEQDQERCDERSMLLALKPRDSDRSFGEPWKDSSHDLLR